MSNYYKVPISYYSIYLRTKSKEGRIFTKKKLKLYSNWKRKFVLLFLCLNILKKVKINSDADIIFKGNRKKEIYFENKKIITYGDCKKDFETRVKMNKDFNCIKKPKYSKEKLEEELIWPTKKIQKKDLIRVFESLGNYYEKNLEKTSFKKIIEEREKRWGLKINSDEKLDESFISEVQGDFWKGNLEKDLNGKIWIFDWDRSGKGSIFEDIYTYFFIEYMYTKKINKKLFKIVKKNFKEKFKLDLKDLNKHIGLESIMNKEIRRKSLLKKIDYFSKKIKKIK